DLAGRREEAVTHYRAVLARPNVYDSHEDARRGLKEPYRLTRRVSDNASDGQEASEAKGRQANYTPGARASCPPWARQREDRKT
ncbi:MAG TPA: hypothetical protein VF570_21225, partial [Pyrinomonadaceae bacterium]